MGFTLFSLLLASVGVIYWFSASEVREAARAYAQAACARGGVQLLDSSVVLRRIRLRRGSRGLHIERRFSFEFSPDGVSRVRGWIDMAGRQLVSATVPFSVNQPPPGGPT